VRLDQSLEAKGEIVVSLTVGFCSRPPGRRYKLLPDIKPGDSSILNHAIATETLYRAAQFATPEASAGQKKLEEMGIGWLQHLLRSTISTIQSRGYVERGDVEGDRARHNCP